MNRKIVVAGYAKMPEGTGARRLYEYLTLNVIVDANTHVVVDVGVTLVTDTGRRWVVEHLTGQHLLEEPATFIESVERDYWGHSQGALAQCYRDIVRRYRAGRTAEGIEL